MNESNLPQSYVQDCFGYLLENYFYYDDSNYSINCKKCERKHKEGSCHKFDNKDNHEKLKELRSAKSRYADSKISVS